MQPRLTIVPLELADANAFVARHHRHHFPVQGHRFSLGCVTNDCHLVGAAIIGRPVARLINPRTVLEVTRLVTDGTHNACSCLYGAAARIGKAMGYERIQTYIIDTETGVSLRAAGWECDGEAGGGKWYHTEGKARRSDQPTGSKQRWSKGLNPPVEYQPPAAIEGAATAIQGGLWE